MPVAYRPDGSINDELPAWIDTMMLVLGVLIGVVLSLFVIGLVLIAIIAHW